MPFGPWEVAILLVILVIIFGAGRLTQVGGALGKTVREFRGAVQDEPAAAPPPVPVSVPQVICAECQASNPVTNKFCSKCGATMRPAEAAPAATAPVEAAPRPPTAPQPPTAPPATAPPTATQQSAAQPDAEQPKAASHGSETSTPAGETAPIDAGHAPHVPTTLPQNTCPSCATVNPPGQPFCGQCGTRLKPAAA